MCKPCKAALKKYQGGGFADSTFINNGPTVKYQDQGVRPSWAPDPYKFDAKNDPIRSGKFNMNQLLKGFETFGTDEGTIEGIQKKDADLTAHGVSLGNDLTREQARVNEVISNIPATTARMRNTSADINNASGTSTSDANRQWGELGSGTAGMTLGERRNYIDSITAYGTIDPNLDHLMPDSHDGTPWTMVDYDDYPEDGPPNPEYGPTRALSCIGSACGAFQEAEKGTGGRKTKMETYNPRFRSKTLAGETNFTEVPWDQVQAGDLIQNEDMTWRDYTDTSKGKVMRTHHAGIAETVNEDGSVNASNAQGGSLAEYGVTPNFGVNENQQYAYRYTGQVPGITRSINSNQRNIDQLGGEYAASQFLRSKDIQNNMLEGLPATQIPQDPSAQSRLVPQPSESAVDLNYRPKRRLFEQYRN